VALEECPPLPEEVEETRGRLDVDVAHGG
jgi:hypothetical protein